ncbi:M4 family metallopeptidase [Hymenobacter crusticola]|uniref:M4 family metallopeptidase n=1 Tax=Hymenobacter crusticola TaxID=1770526 RepID=UPI00117AC586|nr:M4 family metallopeptidase [Hymenobacter crusticola]
MKPSLRPWQLVAVVAATCTLGAAQAQTPTKAFKSAKRDAAPVERPHAQIVIDGSAAAARTPQALPVTPHLQTLARPVATGTSSRVVQATRAQDSGLPVMLKANTKTSSRAAKPTTPEAASFTFLQEVRQELGVQQPAQEFRVVEASRDNLGQTHVRLTQTWKGLPVYGSEIVVHLDAQGQANLLSGRYFRSPSQLTNTTPALPAATAASQAETQLRTKTKVQTLSADAKRLLHYAGPSSELVIFHATPGSAPVLAWHVTTRPSLVQRWESFVDARTGAVLQQYESSCTTDGPRTATGVDLNGKTQSLHTYEYSSKFYLLDGSQAMFNLGQSKLPDEPVGGLLTIDANNTYGDKAVITHVNSANNTWAAGQKSAISAHYNAGIAYSYYRNTHSRNSLDGQGGTMISMVRVADDDGTGLDNAYWNGRFISYGEGNVGFSPLAGGLDVAGHEMTHGVVEKTANLEYKGQSGALNESFADVFGAMMDRDDWNIGEDVVKRSSFPSGTLRSLSDPHNGGGSLNDRGFQPRTMSELYTGSQDNGGVHINSGIPNWAFYKFATAIGKEHAEQVWYRTLTTYLTRSSQFLDLRLGVIQAATDLYGASSTEVNAARAAFDAVGILNGTSQPTPGHNLPINPGQDYILSYDTDASTQGTWFISNTEASNFSRLSNTEAISKPSITDQGNVAVFVDATHRIRALQLSNSPTESIVQNQPIWSNAVISKDGSKLAAVTMAKDTSIYVFNLKTNQMARYKLYLPTTAGGRATGVMYADALEWDYSGEYLIYDSFNAIRNAQGTALSYWDIGFLRVWNNAQNTWGDGRIEKLVQNLPDGISIGNPVLAKNSRNIMAFDLLDENGGAYPFYVMAANLETNDIKPIYEESEVAGTPSFSKNDDKMLFTALTMDGDTVVAVTSLQTSKIEPSGNPAVLISEAKWGVWFTQGQRVLATAPKTLELAGFAAYPNPTRNELHLEADLAAEATLYDLMGRPIRTGLKITPGQRSTIDISTLASGTYLLRATNGQRTATRQIIKE